MLINFVINKFNNKHNKQYIIIIMTVIIILSFIKKKIFPNLDLKFRSS